MRIDPSFYVQEIRSLTSGNAKWREVVTASFDWGLEKRGEQCTDCKGKSKGYERVDSCENCDGVDADYERCYCCFGLRGVSTLDCFEKEGQLTKRNRLTPGTTFVPGKNVAVLLLTNDAGKRG